MKNEAALSSKKTTEDYEIKELEHKTEKHENESISKSLKNDNDYQRNK